ncbi:hypothetical protein ACLIKE_02570 [Ferroplasma acidiphilum]
MKNKLGDDVSPLKIILFGSFVLVPIIGLLAVFVLHSHLLAFISLPLVFIIFIMFMVLTAKDIIKAGNIKIKWISSCRIQKINTAGGTKNDSLE